MTPPWLLLGLMSGTSHDGVDAAVVRFGPDHPPEVVHHSHTPYPSGLRKKISDAFGANADGAADICRLNFTLGEFFARAAMKCIKESGLRASDVAAIASHGQTICHIPPEKGKRGQKGSSLQIGESAVIAARTGIPVVSDFRVADMALGGHGAPLVPFADYVLFHGRKIKAVQNIGGISNVTIVTPNINDVVAFDTGPGNCLIDEAMKALYGRPFDRNGKTAKSGTPDERLLRRLLRHPYFAERPPKSTGRETFNLARLKVIDKIRPGNLLATLTHLTARSIRDAYERFVFPKFSIGEIIVSGGGTKNGFLMGLIKELFSPVKISLMEEYGIPSGAKEAMSFAILADETLKGRPSNLPKVTGARKAVTLGKITLP